MLNLIAKDFKLLFSRTGNKKDKILSSIFTLAIAGIFIYLETFIFNMIIKRVSDFSGAIDSFFTIFLFITAIFLTFACLFSLVKLFFNKEDIQILTLYPISTSKKILSKIFFIFILMYVLNLVFTLPLFISYGNALGKTLFFFYSSLYYPLLIAFFQIGVALVLAYPVKLLLDYLKKHIFIQLLVVVALAFGLTIAYGYVLNLFISLVDNGDLGSIFNKENLSSIIATSKQLIPVNYISSTFLTGNRKGIFPFIGISLGVFLLGLVVCIIAYNYFCNHSVNNKKKVKEFKGKVSSSNIALIKKEFIILFRNSSFLLSFAGLLLVQPLLSYYVVRSMNIVFTSGSLVAYATTNPGLIPLMDNLLLFLIVTIIASGANNYIRNEGKSIRVIKVIPVSPIKQVLIKMFTPLFFSLISTVTTYIVLVTTKVISTDTFTFGLIMAVLLLGVLSVISLYEELSIKRGNSRNTLLSNVFSYLLPFGYFGIGLIFVLNKMSINIVNYVGIGLIVASYLPFLICFKSRINNKFALLEVIN